MSQLHQIKEAYENLLVAASRLLNTLLGGRHNEMLSSRLYRERNWFGVFVIDTIFFWEKDHCRASYEWETSQNV